MALVAILVLASRSAVSQNIVTVLNTNPNGNMWISDYNSGNHGYVTKVLPNGTSFAYNLTGTFDYPHWIAMDNNSNMWVIGFTTAGVERVYQNGTSILYTTNAIATGRYIIFDPHDGYMYGCGNYQQVEKISPKGVITSTGVATLPFKFCNAIGVDANNNIWFSGDSVGYPGGIGNYSEMLTNGTLWNYKGGAPAPNGMAFDGVRMWIGGGTAGNHKVSNINVNTKVITNYTLTTTQNVFPFYDGSSVWFESQDNATAIRILSNGSTWYYRGLGKTPYGDSYNPSQRAMWFASRDSNVITKINIDTGAMVNYTLPDTYGPHGMAFSGAYLDYSYSIFD